MKDNPTVKPEGTRQAICSPASWLPIEDQDANSLAKLSQYDLNFLIEPILARQRYLSPSWRISFERIPLALCKFKRHIALLILGHDDVAIDSDILQVWEQLCLLPTNHRDFCREVFQRFADYSPSTFVTMPHLCSRKLAHTLHHIYFGEVYEDVAPNSAPHDKEEWR